MSQSLSNSNNSAPTVGSNGLRNFLCVDCNLGFRTHGVLAKHLRSKNHVKMLVTLGMLPEDSNELIKEHSYVLSGVDVSNCDMARKSLLCMC